MIHVLRQKTDNYDERVITKLEKTKQKTCCRAKKKGKDNISHVAFGIMVGVTLR